MARRRLTREQFINVELKRMFKLKTSMAEKPVMNVDDIYLILYHHWVMDTATFPDGRQRLQIDFLELLIAGTATRPGALVYVRRNEKRIKGHYIGEDDSDEEEEAKDKHGHNRNDSSDRGDSDWEDEDDKTLCYKDVSLLLLPNPGSIRDLLVMEVDIGHTKGHVKKQKRYVPPPHFHHTPQPPRPSPKILPTAHSVTYPSYRKIFLQSEVDDLIFDPVIRMIALAVIDDAFEADITSIEHIFRLRVRAPRRSLQLKFKKEMLGKPIFRRAESTIDGVRTSVTKALRYHTFLYYHQRLGKATGFPQILKPYDIRRGTGNALDGMYYEVGNLNI